MRFNLKSGSISQGLIAIGSGAAILAPENRWIGAIIILVGVLTLVFDIQLERGQVRLGTPSSLLTRLKTMTAQFLMVTGFALFLIGLTLYLREASEKRALNEAAQEAAKEAASFEARLREHPEEIRKPDEFMRHDRQPTKIDIKPHAHAEAPILEDSLVERADFVARLCRLYVLSHDGISPGMMSGLELPPKDWLNAQLKSNGKTWRIKSIHGNSFDSYNIKSDDEQKEQQSVKVTSSPGSIIAPLGGINTITNNFGPPDRIISDSAATKIAEALRSAGAFSFVICDYTNGQDQETQRYIERVASILVAGGWKNNGVVKFMPIGGAVVGLKFFGKPKDRMPSGTVILSRILQDAHVSFTNEYMLFPAIVDARGGDEETVGIAIGAAPR